MTDNNADDRNLDLFFDAARQAAPRAPDALLARVMQDAVSVQAGQLAQPSGAPAAPHAGSGLFGQLWSALGGWGGAAGLATACAAGIWIGLAPPQVMPDPVQLVSSASSDYDVFVIGDLAAEFASEGG